MMSKHGYLWLLLIAQLGLAAWLLVRGSGDDATALPFADVDEQAIAGLRIEAADTRVELTRTEQGWRVGEHPADSARVRDTIRSLHSVEVAWPVASSDATARRFEVAEDNSQRRVAMLGSDGEILAVALLGTSPGYQRVHLRRQGTEGIYAVALSHLDFPETVDGWLDRSLLQPEGRVEAVTFEPARGDAWSLSEASDGWLIDGVAADEEAAQSLIARLTGLRVTGVSKARDGVLIEPVGTLTIEARDGDQTSRQSLVIEGWGGRDNELASYQIGRADSAARYGLAAYIAEQLAVESDAWVSSEGDSQDSP